MRIIIATLLLVLLANCGGSGPASGHAGIALQMKFAQKFNSAVPLGKIDKFKVILTGEEFPTPIIRLYSSKDTEAVIDGLKAGSKVRVEVQAINYNGYVIRRGRSDELTIQGGKNNPANITINNVPIFANVVDGSTVYAERFVPIIFAPGNIQFQVSNGFNGSESVLTDESSGNVSFSISESDPLSIRTIHTKPFEPGLHALTVQDPATGETTQITIHVIQGANNQVLSTTAGNYFGTILTDSKDIKRRSDLVKVYENLTNSF